MLVQTRIYALQLLWVSSDYRPHSDGLHSSAESISLFQTSSRSSSGSTGSTPPFPAVLAIRRENRSYAYRSALSSAGYQLTHQYGALD
jgi:hypothetical protein